MDDTDNTPDVVDRDQLVGQIYIQPTKTAEFIILNFNISWLGNSYRDWDEWKEQDLLGHPRTRRNQNGNLGNRTIETK